MHSDKEKEYFSVEEPSSHQVELCYKTVLCQIATQALLLL